MTIAPATLTTASPEATAQVRRLFAGVRLSQAISVAASLGIADALTDGPRTSEDIAAVVGGDPPTTYRLLRALAAGGILHESEDRTFSLTELGVTLRSDVAGSVRDQAINFGKPYMLAAWGNLEHSIRTGENAFTALHGEDVWAFRARDPKDQSDFNRAMASYSAAIGPALAAAYPFGAIGTLADLGGGSGTLLAAVLAAHSQLRGILFDQPAVVAESGPILRRAGVADRTEVVGGDFFASVPAADAYVMKSILHDWSDTDSIRILRAIRAAAPTTARLLIVEHVLGGPNDDLDGKLLDLHMLVMPGGLERTLDEWRDLFASGGWTLTGIRPLVAGFQLIEGSPAA